LLLGVRIQKYFGKQLDETRIVVRQRKKNHECLESSLRQYKESSSAADACKLQIFPNFTSAAYILESSDIPKNLFI
jgi:hypothetical protein